MTGSSFASQKAAMSSAACALHLPPPTITSGRSAWSSRSRSCSSSSWPGCVCTGRYGPGSATSTSSTSMSSGSASTTGPGLPAVATLKARASSSGIRSAVSICATHFAIELNIRR